MLMDNQIKSLKIETGLIVNLLFFITLWNIHQIDAASCLFSNDQLGQCVKFEDCPSAIALSARGVNPAFCNLEEGIVCCTDNIRKTESGSRPSAENWQSDYPNQKNPHENIHDVYQYETDNQRKKHSIGKPGENHNENNYGKQKIINDDPYQYEKPVGLIPNGGINRKPIRRPSGTILQTSNESGEDDYFVPPGLSKKKPGRDEKTTENEFYYEQVTKKPGRGPIRKGSNKHDNYNPHTSPKRTNDDNSRRNEWSNQGGRKPTDSYDWYDHHPNEYENDYAHQRTTTTRNRWVQDTTTKRNDYYGNNDDDYYNVKPTSRPNRPQSEDNFYNRPSYQSSKPQGNTRPSYQQGSSSSNNRPEGSWPQENYQPNTQQGSRPGNWQQSSQGSRPQGSNRPNTKPPRRISEQKCEEYSKPITENITGLPLTTNPDPVIIPVRKCVTPQQLIVGGENTTIGEFPHMAAIGFRDGNKKQIAWNCGGTLISDQYVITAAHCASTTSGRPVKVRLGEYNLMKNDDGAHPVDYAVVDVIIHPEYRRPSKYNDIALLRLSRKVTFFKHIRPACLYAEDNFSVSVAIATGWGQTYYDGKKSEILQKVALSIVDNKTCNRLYKVNIKTEALSRGIIDSQMCAGELAGGKDTCQGDSGGPLSITSTKCIHHIIGVTSFGKSCALPNSTGVYTRISAYLPWIESIVWPTN